MAAGNRRSSELDELSQQRLWKSLDLIASKVGDIEGKLNDLIRLEEKVSNHHVKMENADNRLNDHSDRLRGLELWQATQKANSVEKDIKRVEKEVESIKSDLDNRFDELVGSINSLKTTVDKNMGEKKVSYSIIKWGAGIIATVFVALLVANLKGS